MARGDFAYAVGVQGEPPDVRVENPRLIQFRVAIDADEIDLGPGSALLSPELAGALTRQPRGDETTERLGDSSGAHAAASAAGEDSPISGEPSAHLPDRTAHRSVTLDINATEDDLHTLQLALHGLREIVRPGPLRIELRVTATKPHDEIDAGAFQNRVRQHLEEDEDVRFEERWE